MLDDGRFRGRIYGKPSVKDGKWIVTSYVPPEKRDLEGRSVWTESGSCYLLGAPAEPEQGITFCGGGGGGGGGRVGGRARVRDARANAVASYDSVTPSRRTTFSPVSRELSNCSSSIVVCSAESSGGAPW